MAVLSLEEIQKLLKTSRQNDEIKYAIDHDKRVVFHTEPTEQTGDIPYLRQYLAWIRDIIDENKHDVFKHLLTLPIETVDFTEGVFNQLRKIFNAPDRFKQHEFTNPELATDYEEYLELIDNDETWKTKGFQAMKSAINSFLIVDLPAVQLLDDRPQPYFYFLPISHVRHVKIGENMKVEYIAFEDVQDPDILHVFDDLFYRSYRQKDGNFILLVENAHDLGYTPARSFWSVPFNSKRKIQKRAPISNALSRLDWLLAEYTFSKHEELYAGFPVDIMYEQKCEYVDDDGNNCENGYVNYIVDNAFFDDENRTPVEKRYACPQCNSNKPVLGPGTLLTAPSMEDNQDADLIQGLNRVSADVQSLDWIMKRIDNMEKTLTINMIGHTQEQSREAMNELQVMGNVESRETVIMEIKRNFEKAETFVVKTIASLRYGQAYLGSKIFYGEKFFFHGLDSIRDSIKLSKEVGLPNFEIAKQQKQLLDTKYQNNHEALAKIEILTQLEPYQGYTLQELLDLNSAFRLDEVKVTIKANFQEYILRFENEFTNIVNFMQFSTLSEKVEFIKVILERYANEELTSEEDQEDNSGGFGRAENETDPQRDPGDPGE